jgi:hypothetical protein
VALGLILAMIAVASIAGTSRLARRRQIVLAGLRLAALLLIVAGLFRISLAIERTNLPWLAILVDRSASMAREDVSTSKAGRESRLTAVRDWMGRQERNPVAELRSSYRVRMYEFAADAREIDVGAGPFTLAGIQDTLSSLQPDGSQTRLATSLRTVLSEFRGTPPAAVIVITDGASSEGASEQLSAAAVDASSKTVPLWTVGVGSDSGSPDVEVTEVLVDNVTLVDETLAFDVQLHSANLSTTAIEVRLLSENGDLLDSVSSSPSAMRFQSVTLRTRPDEEGIFTYIVEAAPLPQESNAENNKRAVTVQVRNRKLRVLYVERLPRWEFRHLKAALERDAAVELKSVLIESDLDYIREDRTALAQAPSTSDEVQEHDAVILGDVNPAEIPSGFSVGLRELVGKRAGGLILIAGPRFRTAAWSGSPLESLLPVHPLSPTPPANSEIPARAVAITAAGREHPLFRLDESQAGPFAPVFNWWSPSGDLKAGATTLLNVDAADGSHSPIVVTQRFGNGIVLWHATDEFWKLRRLREDAVYGRYWSQAIRWVSRGRLAGNSLAGELRSDRRVYGAGEMVRLELRVGEHIAVDPLRPPRIEVQPPYGPPHELATTRDSEKVQSFVAMLAPARAGEYHVRWIDPPAGEESVEGRFAVDAGTTERAGSPLDRADLEKAATISHGRFIPWQDVDEFHRQLPTGRPIPTSEPLIRPLWNRWELASLFAAIVCLEWFVRRRNSLV